VRYLCKVWREVHEHGWLYRDIKPSTNLIPWQASPVDVDGVRYEHELAAVAAAGADVVVRPLLEQAPP